MLPSCQSDVCCQGRNKCPTPEACQLPESYCRPRMGLVRGWERKTVLRRDAGAKLLTMVAFAALCYVLVVLR